MVCGLRQSEKCSTLFSWENSTLEEKEHPTESFKGLNAFLKVEQINTLTAIKKYESKQVFQLQLVKLRSDRRGRQLSWYPSPPNFSTTSSGRTVWSPRIDFNVPGPNTWQIFSRIGLESAPLQPRPVFRQAPPAAPE
ncbi:hypothetical protein AVEN_224103-1 [Araneus ventricosus]|uniref:Uncharacterized protein n=1 Tax=Araneus ventricosus TaxID=182803 RepID=A0A4Y2DYX6_ARAVE|nr:hypothetical protein AVEN_224103-1 [Araneus ventricosus]